MRVVYIAYNMHVYTRVVSSAKGCTDHTQFTQRICFGYIFYSSKCLDRAHRWVGNNGEA